MWYIDLKVWLISNNVHFEVWINVINWLWKGCANISIFNNYLDYFYLWSTHHGCHINLYLIFQCNPLISTAFRGKITVDIYNCLYIENRWNPLKYYTSKKFSVKHSWLHTVCTILKLYLNFLRYYMFKSNFFKI